MLLPACGKQLPSARPQVCLLGTLKLLKSRVEACAAAAGIGIGRIAGLVQRLYAHRDAAGNEQQGCEQNEPHSLHESEILVAGGDAASYFDGFGEPAAHRP